VGRIGHRYPLGMTVLMQSLHDVMVHLVRLELLPAPSPAPPATGGSVTAIATSAPAIPSIPASGTIPTTVTLTTETTLTDGNVLVPPAKESIPPGTWVTGGVALVAALVALGAAWLTRITGREANANTKKSAKAAADSAAASMFAAESTSVNAAVTAKRAEQEFLSNRYHEAVDHLGHEKAAVRLAGIYALARLADDWDERRQDCLDLPCDYLRMPVKHVNKGDDEDEYKVRRSIFRVFNTHLEEAATTSWSNLSFDLSDTTLSGVSIFNATFEKQPIFRNTIWTGDSHFSGVQFLKAPFSTAARLMERWKLINSRLRMSSASTI
jgi:hypothetical protein